MWILRVKEKFDAAHFIPNHPGKCKNLHGHTWKVEIFIKVKDIDKGTGISIDFSQIKKDLREILPDHKFLNQIFDFPPSAENISRYIYKKLKEKGYNILKVVLWETEKNGVEYFEEI